MVAYVIIFNYVPMIWQLMAFQDVKPALGLFGSKWVGLENFTDFFSINDYCGAASQQRKFWNAKFF